MAWSIRRATIPRNGHVCSTSGSGPPAYRGDGTRQAWDTGTSRIYDDDTVAALLAGAEAIDDDDHRRGEAVQRHPGQPPVPALLRHAGGYGDTGPLRGARTPGRSLLVRDFYRLAHGDFPWSEVARDVPYHHLTAALVLDDVQSTFTDFGTSNHTPEDYLDRLVAFGLYTTDGLPPGELRRSRRRARRHRGRGP